MSSFINDYYTGQIVTHHTVKFNNVSPSLSDFVILRANSSNVLFGQINVIGKVMVLY